MEKCQEIIEYTGKKIKNTPSLQQQRALK